MDKEEVARCYKDTDGRKFSHNGDRFPNRTALIDHLAALTGREPRRVGNMLSKCRGDAAAVVAAYDGLAAKRQKEKLLISAAVIVGPVRSSAKVKSAAVSSRSHQLSRRAASSSRPQPVAGRAKIFDADSTNAPSRSGRGAGFLRRLFPAAVDRPRPGSKSQACQNFGGFSGCNRRHSPE
jgi:hypothetical protein